MDVSSALTHMPNVLTCATRPPSKKPWNDLGDQEGLRKQNQQISYTHRSPLHLPTPISTHFCLLSFLTYELSFFSPFPPYASDKLLFTFVECTQTSGLSQVSLFCFLKGTLPSFFLSFGYEQGKKRPWWLE